MQKIREQVTLQSNDVSASYGGGGISSAFSGRKTQIKLVIALGLAVICAGSAVFLANAWFDAQYDKFNSVQAPPPEVDKPALKVVVASKQLAYGTALTPGVLKEIEWPADAVPQGAFHTTKELITNEGARVVLTPMAQNEPVLATKITKPGQPASLSAMLEDGYKAVTIRVDDVLGVAGLITPGDRVDVMWTRVGNQAVQDDQTYTELLLRGVRVLALDQTVEENSKGSNAVTGFAKAVTIEVGTLQAQKVALAASTGKFLLALQHVAENNTDRTRRVTMSDLSIRLGPKRPSTSANDGTLEASTRFGVNKRPASSLPQSKPENTKSRLVVSEDYAIVGVTRGLKRSEYNVRQAVEPQ